MIKSVYLKNMKFIRFFMFYLVYLSALDPPRDHKTCTSTGDCSSIHCGHNQHGKVCSGGKCYCTGKHEKAASEDRSTPVAFKCLILLILALYLLFITPFMVQQCLTLNFCYRKFCSCFVRPLSSKR